ncbi:MAG: hypothetical protein QGG40_04685, partial [Myxococcota bacterium]|nr:hypothetical protein [Myxococcota bacterium]
EPPPATPGVQAAGVVEEPPPDPFPSRLLLDGQQTSVHWDDGDTFKRLTTDGSKGQGARLQGYNTLESYGPVHRWGEWTGQELYALAKDAGRVA